jgi:dTMP kinase
MVGQNRHRHGGPGRTPAAHATSTATAGQRRAVDVPHEAGAADRQQRTQPVLQRGARGLEAGGDQRDDDPHGALTFRESRISFTAYRTGSIWFGPVCRPAGTSRSKAPRGVARAPTRRVSPRRVGAVLTRETGGTAIGQRIRTILHDTAITDLSHRAEALLTAADRAQHIHQVVLPALTTGRHVVSDRSVYSTLAYQGYGRELAVTSCATSTSGRCTATGRSWCCCSTRPGRARTAHARPRARPLRTRGRRVPPRVRDGFQAMAAAEPDRWVVIDGSRPIDGVAAHPHRCHRTAGHLMFAEYTSGLGRSSASRGRAQLTACADAQPTPCTPTSSSGRPVAPSTRPPAPSPRCCSPATTTPTPAARASH